jgi:hypothetical protein
MFLSITSSLQHCIQLALIMLSLLAMLPISAAQNTTITVTTTMPGMNADGQCSLAEALTNANADAATAADCPAGSGADVIMLTTGATYTLTAVDNTTDGANGLPSITSDITIMGKGATIQRSTADGTPEFRIFHVAAKGALRLHELTVANGVARGQDGEIPTLGAGGGIYSRGTMTAENSIVRDNIAAGGNFIDESGRLYGDGGAGFGGGINCNNPDYYTVSTIILTNTLISNNHAVGGEGWSGGYVLGGGIACGLSTTLTINNSVIEENSVNGGNGRKGNTSNFRGSAYGGGLFVGSIQSLHLTNAVIRNNRAIGGNSVANSDIDGGKPGQGAGGGVYIADYYPSSRLPEIRNSTIANNMAKSGTDGFGRTDPQLSYGGGIGLESSSISIIASHIHDNHTEGKGGGISIAYLSQLNVTMSTISGNAAQQGGGTFAHDNGTLYLRNSTISGNIAVRGGGIMNASDQDRFGNTFAWNSTISFNQATESGGGLVNDSVVQGNAGARLYNSIVSNNVAGDCSSQGGGVASGGYNLDSDGSCGFGTGVGDLPHTDPKLGPLQDNGGPTWTHALLPGSPAIDHIDDAGCRFDYNNAPIAEDQRGVARPQGAACDIGAYEAEQSFVTPTAIPSTTPTEQPTSTPTPTLQPTGMPAPKTQHVLLPLIMN